MSDGKKKLSFLTVISTIICVVFVCEAAAPAAAIGNQQFFWWIFLILTFLLPYGMVVAELGTTYDGVGGVCPWVLLVLFFPFFPLSFPSFSFFFSLFLSLLPFCSLFLFFASEPTS